MESDLAKGWLVFESDREKRRLRPIPDGWELRSESELLALLAESAPAPRMPRRLIE
ncbi:MAG: hypothetical protein JWL95_172 [Gemmatimonadetes bacterium]|nr:hypothetical protein [Gemmatimonadota bacterium]